MHIRCGSLLTVVALGFTTALCYQAASQSYPTRQITIVIPFPAGGNLEIVARPLADRLSASLGQPVIIENRPGGAGGTVGTKAVANAKPDGYTLLLTPAAPLVTAPAIYKNLGYDPLKDFVPVATLFSVPHMLVVHPALPVDSMERLVGYAKANPGKVSYASPGFGTQPHLLAELFRLTTGANIVHVPYKGATPAVTDILAGQVQMYFDSVALFLPHIQAGKLRALAVADDNRNNLLPGVPTTAESGFPELQGAFWACVACARRHSRDHRQQAQSVDQPRAAIARDRGKPRQIRRKAKIRFAARPGRILEPRDAEVGKDHQRCRNQS
jgi:tripartite-type tricarboxylate transporter receptor subunit TctC